MKVWLVKPPAIIKPLVSAVWGTGTKGDVVVVLVEVVVVVEVLVEVVVVGGGVEHWISWQALST